MAEYAAVAGLLRYISALVLPMRPLKLRLAVERTVSASEGTPLQVPTQGPQEGAMTVAPALTSLSM